MKEVAFDNDKYLKLQSKHILERISNFDNKYIWSLAESCLMITMLPEFCRDFSRIVNWKCSLS